jgi:outer membrane protein assembly factor BamB
MFQVWIRGSGRSLTLVVSLVAILGVSTVGAGDWSRFRGPNGTGVSEDTAPAPDHWSPTENLKWKVDLPGPGSSSPIVVGDRVYLTCWSGYGVDRSGDPGSPSELKRHLMCFDRTNGQTIWDKVIDPYLPEDNYGGMFAEHGYASHTPACDGERIYVFFGKTGVLAFDLEGNKLWQTSVGTESDPRGWGSASSPVVYKDLVIILASAESEALVALNKMTGEQVWRQEAQGFGGTWGTPVLIPVDDKRTDLVLGVPGEIWGFNPNTGKLVWSCEAMPNNSFCSSVVTDGKVVYAIEGMGGGSIAVRAGGKGDVTASNVVWQGSDNNRISTPVLHEDRLYFFSRSVANCIEASGGKRVYQARLTRNGEAPSSSPQAEEPRQFGGGRGFGGRGGRGGPSGGQDYSSPVIADGKLYFTSRGGDTYVIRLGEKFEQISINRVTTDTEDFSGVPAISNGEIFIRSNRRLYCVASAAK